MKAITAYEDANRKLHRTQAEAEMSDARCEVHNWVTKHYRGSGGATMIADTIIQHADKLQPILSKLVSELHATGA